MKLRDSSLPRSYRYQDILSKPTSYYGDTSSYSKYSTSYTKPPTYGSYASRALHRQEVRDYLTAVKGPSYSNFTNGEIEKSTEYSYSSYRTSSKLNRAYSSDNSDVFSSRKYDDTDTISRYSTLGRGNRFRLSGGSNLDFSAGGRYCYSNSSSRGGSSRGSPEDVKVEPRKSLLIEESVPRKNYLEEHRKSSILEDIKKATVEEAKPPKSIGDDSRKSIYDGIDNRRSIYDGIDNRKSIYDGVENRKSIYDGADNRKSVYDGADNRKSVYDNVDNRKSIYDGIDNIKSICNGVDSRKSISDSVDNRKSISEESETGETVEEGNHESKEEDEKVRKSSITADDSSNIQEEFPRRNWSRTRTSSSGSGSISLSNNQAARGLVGLRNIGNTCFMNSVLQCLSNTRPLLDYILEKQYESELNTSLSKTKGALMKAFAALLQGLWNEDKENLALSTLTLKRAVEQVAPCFSGYAQQDAQEFLVYLLEGLHQDVNRVTTKPKSLLHESEGPSSAIDAWKKYLRLDDSKLVDLCVGQLKSSLQCTDCGYTSVTWDPFWDLSLPLPSGQRNTELTRCLDLFMKEEVLDGDEKPFCSRCNARKRCTKSFSIQKFPRILVLHLKRFPPRGNYSGKLNGLVEFPLQNLSMRNYSSEVCNPVYNLIGVVNHTGGALSGHYTAHAKHPFSGEWHEYNDTRVAKVNIKRIVTEQAYVLFYELSGR